MKSQTPGARCENTQNIISNGIDNAFKTMVHRCLVQGTNGEWQLAPTKEKKTGSKKVDNYSTGSRKQASDKSKCSTGSKTRVTSGLNSTHINHKLTADFLQRSKLRFLSSEDAGLKSSDHETSKPEFGQQEPQPGTKDNGVRSATMDEEGPSPSNASSNVAVETEDGHVQYSSTTTTEDNNTSKPSESVPVSNDEVTPCDDNNSNGKRATGTPSSSKLKGAKRAKRSRSQAIKKNVKAKRDLSNVRAEVEGQESRRITRTMSAHANYTSSAVDESSEQVSAGIVMLCNGQIKCKMECCYKAAYRDGVCAEHEEDKTCVAQGCNNLPFSTGLCREHVGCKLRLSVEGAVQKATVAANSERVESSSGNRESSKSAVVIDIEDSSSTLPDSSRPKPHRAKKRSKPPTSNSWHSSDLPSLFRTAGNRRERMEDGSKDGEREKVGHAAPKRKRKNLKAARGKCRVIRCTGDVASDGLCEEHAKCKACCVDGCKNLAINGVRGVCSHHGGRRKCRIEECTTNAQYQGLCAKHGGGRKRCRERGCSKKVFLHELCWMHAPQNGDQLAPRRGRKKCEDSDAGWAETLISSQSSEKHR